MFCCRGNERRRRPRRLRDCDIRVLAVLAVSRRGGESDICVGELANRAGVSESSVHNARRNLERLGYLTVAERRKGPIMVVESDASVAGERAVFSS